MSKNSVKKDKKTEKTDFSAIKKLLRYARPYIPAIVGSLFCSIVQIAATLYAPVVIGNTVDYIIGENNVNFEIIFKNAGILGGLVAAVMIFQYLMLLVCITHLHKKHFLQNANL